MIIIIDISSSPLPMLPSRPQNRDVLYTVSTEVIIACPMKFASYPLDHQLCKFLVNINASWFKAIK